MVVEMDDVVDIDQVDGQVVHGQDDHPVADNQHHMVVDSSYNHAMGVPHNVLVVVHPHVLSPAVDLAVALLLHLETVPIHLAVPDLEVPMILLPSV